MSLYGIVYIFTNTIYSISVLIITSVITLDIVYLLSKYKRSVKKEYNNFKLYHIALFIVLFVTLYLLIAQLSTENVTINHIIISGIVLIAVNTTMIVIDRKIYNAIPIENKENMLRQQNEALQNEMEIIRKTTETVRLLKHDFKDHLIMLTNLYKSGRADEIEPYISTILENMENEAYANSNNFVIDSIINYKLRGIKDSNIKLLMSINIPITISISAYDLNVILANLLDNAILACESSKQKVLDIKIGTRMDNLLIIINNSYDGKIIEDNGKFKTTKLFKENHGLGLTSVKNTVQKYDGEMRIEYSSDTFSTSVIIPY